MIGEMIQEYLVGLGAKIDRPGFAEFNRTIDETSKTIEKATGSWTKNFVQASAAITSAIAGVTTAVGGLMKAAAQEDLEMEKLASNLMTTKEAAREMKKATDALGESVNNIATTPELLGRYRQLINDGRQMKFGGDFEQTAKSFRDLLFEFTRLKQEVSYAMSWVGYYLMKYLNRPLNEATEKFRTFNNMFVKNMSNWTEKAARALIYVINTGKHFFDFISEIGKALNKMWDSFPDGVKKATLALTTLWLAMKMNPLGRMILLVGTLLLLIDDYFGHMEGKQAQFGAFWDKLNGYIERGKRLWTEFIQVLTPLTGEFEGVLSGIKNKFLDFVNGFENFIDKIQKSDAFRDFIEKLKILGSILYDIGENAINIFTDALEFLYDTIANSGVLEVFYNALNSIWRVLVKLARAFLYCIEVIGGWLEELKNSETVREFMAAVAELANAVIALFDAIIDLVETGFKELFAALDDTEHAITFRDAIKTVIRFLSAMARALTFVTQKVTSFLRAMRDNRIFKMFWQGIANSVKLFTNIIDRALNSVGKLAAALAAFKSGHFVRAAELVKEAYDDFKNYKPEEDTSSRKKKRGKSGGIEEYSDPRIGIAKYVAKKIGGDPRLIYGQMIHEASWNLSDLAKYDKNYSGIKYYGKGLKGPLSPEGDYYQKFLTDKDFADEYAKVLQQDNFSPALKAENAEDFVRKLKDGGYFTSSNVDDYIAGVKSGAAYYEKVTREEKPRNIESPEVTDENAKKVAQGLQAGLDTWVGRSMELGNVGCVEAAEKIGSYYSDFLREEYDRGVRYVPTLIEDAIKTGLKVEHFDESKLSSGDLVTWSDSGGPNAHVGVFTGYKNGVPYVADNSSRENRIVERPLYRSWQSVESIIKTGAGSGNYSAGQNSFDDKTFSEDYKIPDIFKSDEKSLPIYNADFSSLEKVIETCTQTIVNSISEVGSVLKNFVAGVPKIDVPQVYPGNSPSITYKIEVGGITVNGANKTGKEIGYSIMDSLRERANFAHKNIIVNGTGFF